MLELISISLQEIPDKADLSCIERERLEAEVRKLKHQLKEGEHYVKTRGCVQNEVVHYYRGCVLKT